jgi:hypothetical protein
MVAAQTRVRKSGRDIGCGNFGAMRGLTLNWPF